MVVLPVDSQVLCKLTDSLRQESYLDACGAGIGGMHTSATRYLFLLFFGEHASRG